MENVSLDSQLVKLMDSFELLFPSFTDYVYGGWRFLYLLQEEPLLVGRDLLLGEVRSFLFDVAATEGHPPVEQYRRVWAWLQDLSPELSLAVDVFFASVCCLPALLDWCAAGYDPELYLDIYPVRLHDRIRSWDQDTHM